MMLIEVDLEVIVQMSTLLRVMSVWSVESMAGTGISAQVGGFASETWCAQLDMNIPLLGTSYLVK